MTAATIEWLSDVCMCIRFFAIVVCFAVVAHTVVYFFDEWGYRSKLFSVKKIVILIVCALLIIFVPNEHFWEILREQYGL